MQKVLFFFLLSFNLPGFLLGQNSNLQINGKGNNLYLSHKVVKGENFYSVGRMYNVSPRDLATYNKISMDKGLNIGQVLKVPLDQNNYTQSTVKSAAEELVPVYHKVASGETLFRIGANYGNVPLEDLKQWNGLVGDQLNAGANLVVGYLRVNKTESPLASSGIKVEEKKQEVIPAAEIVPIEETGPPQVAKEEKQEKQEKEIKEPPKVAADATPEQLEANKPTVLLPLEKTTSSKEGFFKNEFEKLAAGNGVSSVTGTGAIFKSTSGWQDEKYYCFNNQAAPGSIVKVSVLGSSKSIYAKVLDAIPDIKQNEGVTLVLSNSAADALGVSGEKFDAVISYFK
ncbi:MAG: LysM peptidoglycan-binding domain-containing protein [Chitinophagaceae bacterium]|nr:LysM peptidoglycan-binding domain-containing protein [Chitinophagaceae bacterium]